MPGGVCAVLDYEVELMAEYVAEMSTRLATGTSRVSDPFRKFISQILSSTRLPRTTILLGMNYFAKRINMMNMMSPNKLTISEGHIWRLLTVALLLGSKFLDDNTFQNRSWADVSGIPVSELNKLEREWMETISWGLYVNLDRSEDYTAWINSWSDWEATKKRQQALASRERLASLVLPVDSDPSNPRNSLPYSAWHQQQVAEYERLSRMKRTERSIQQSYSAHDGCWPYQPQADPWSGAPLTPPDSGYGTPDYINSAAAINTQYEDWFNQQAQQAAARAVANGTYGRQQYHASANPTPYHPRNFPAKLPTYNFYGHNIWEHSVDNLGHGHHGKQISYFGATHPYSQPVVG
ncbi:cyclin-like protein [Niveomyces insectorum RCEF 264]|uniref:Cyclin-like protein n=1 Tax=Niveomyces insectorum RCEF 264 TaxID=1081102 RepID=A0A167UQ57_9HYPO|nr:cyclin-like protein [Niveomyces insectorum RCEF 264]